MEIKLLRGTLPLFCHGKPFLRRNMQFLRGNTHLLRGNTQLLRGNTAASPRKRVAFMWNTMRWPERGTSSPQNFPCELKRHAPLNIYWFYTTGGGRENKVTCQHRGQNITSQFYKYECFNMGTDIQHINCENCQVEILFVYSFCNNCGNRLDTGKYTYYKVLLFYIYVIIFICGFIFL
jgi:hypothetical protein